MIFSDFSSFFWGKLSSWGNVRLTKNEWDSLRLQIETSKGRGGTRYSPYALTEQGLAMLSGI